MNILSRRALLGATAFAPLALAGCGIVTRTTTGGVTTITVDVAKLDAYSKAIQNGADALLANPLIAAAMGPGVAIAIAAALAGVGAAIAAIDKQANGSQSLSFNANSAPAALVSLQADAATVYSDVKTAFAATAGQLPAAVAQVFDALVTVVSLLLAVMLSVGATKAARSMPAPKMPEARALALLHA